METTMASIGESTRFDVSTADFRQKAREVGWPFWRGVVVGFLAAFPIAYIALGGDSFLGLG